MNIKKNGNAGWKEWDGRQEGKAKNRHKGYTWQDARVKKKFISSSYPFLTTNSEAEAGQDLALAVSHSVVALVRLRHPLGRPHLPSPQQPTPARAAGLSIRPVPQHNCHGLWGSTAGRKVQQGAIFRDVVLKVFPIVSVVGLDAFWSRTQRGGNGSRK